MNEENEDRMDPALKAGIVKRIVQVALMILLQAAMLLLSSGHLTWVWAWIFIGLNLIVILISAPFMFSRNPETIAERGQEGDMKGWDKIVGGLWGLIYFILLLLVAGLDERFGWTGSIPLWIHIAGCFAFLLGGAFFSWAMISNAYFSTVVRIQEDRGHTVCDTGPYRFVRHPGYVGAILQSFALPLMLGSFWSLIPGGIAGVLMVIRTALEDRTLREELDGYRDYTRQTHYRLLPGIW